jgi:hypothetical protein
MTISKQEARKLHAEAEAFEELAAAMRKCGQRELAAGHDDSAALFIEFAKGDEAEAKVLRAQAAGAIAFDRDDQIDAITIAPPAPNAGGHDA